MPADSSPSPVIPDLRPRPAPAVSPWLIALPLAAAVALVALWRPGSALMLALGAVAGATAMAAWLRAARASPATPAVEAAGGREPGWLGDALDGLPDPHLVVEGLEADDLAGRRIRFANAAAMETLKVPREGTALVTALRDPRVLEAVDEALFGQVPRVTDYETGGAQTRYWRAWTAPLPAESGARAVVRLRDETDSRRMEAMRVDFLANASHELRTPLASLSGFIETLKGHARDDAQARERFLDIMAAQADRMSRLVADLLSLSRIELSEHIPPTGEADLRAVVLDVIDATALIAAQRGVDIHLVEDRGTPARIVGDRDQLIQVVQNLVDNAVKYSPSGGEVRLTLRMADNLTSAQVTQREDLARLPLVTPDRGAGGGFAVLTVADQGPGMSREHLPRLTERFYRVEGQKSGERSGTGLGLAIVKHIVNRHRGGLAVESRRGGGTVFTVYLPSMR